MQLGGFTDAECSKVWLATEDQRTRPEHLAVDGQKVGITQPFIVWGEGLQFPGDPSGRADNVIQCRCSMAYEFADDADGDADDLDDDLVTAAKDPNWDPTEHPKGPDGRFIKKGTTAYLNAVHKAKFAKATGIKLFDYDDVSLMNDSDFNSWFKNYFGHNGANSANLEVWNALNDEEKDLLASKALNATQVGLSTPYTMISDLEEMEKANVDLGFKKPQPDFVNELIDQDALAKASQPKPKKTPKIVAKPMKINTTVIYKTEYADGAVVAELPLKPPDSPYRLTWSEKDKKFHLQEQQNGNWITVEKHGKGSAYKTFKDQVGWTTPAMAQQEIADKILAKYDSSKIVVKEATEVLESPFGPSNLSSMTPYEIDKFFENLTPAKYNAYAVAEKNQVSDFAYQQGAAGNDTPNQKLNDILKSFVEEGDSVGPGALSTSIVDLNAVLNMPADVFNLWFHNEFVDEDDQGVGVWNALTPSEKEIVKDKAGLAHALGFHIPLTLIKNAYTATFKPSTDSKIPYPDFENMNIVATNSWFESLSPEQYGNFADWEQEGLWAEAKEADDDYGNPKPLEALKSLTGKLSLPGPKTSLPAFTAMSNGQKSAWFAKLTQDEFNQLTEEEVDAVLAEAVAINALGFDAPFKKVTQFFASKDVNANDSSLDDDIDFTANKPFKMIEEMDAAEFKTYVQGLGNIETPSDTYWDTAEKLGLTSWAENYVQQESPHHDKHIAPVTVMGTPVPTTPPLPDKFTVVGMSQQEVMQAAHAFATAKVKPANDIGQPAMYDASFKTLTKASALKLQASMLQKAGKTWTDAEIAAVQQYTTKVGYQTSNAILRNDQKRMAMFSNPQLQGGVQRAIDLQNAMTPLTESVILHRGTGAQAFGFSTTNVSTDELKKLQGKTIQDRGFGSTSVVAPKGITFDYASKPVKVIVKAPAGTPGVYVTSAYPGWATENEFILAAGTSYRIDEVRGATSDDKNAYGDGVEQVVTVTIVPHKGTPTDQLKPGEKITTPAGTSVTPAPALKPPQTPQLKIKPSGSLTPIKLNTKTIHSLKYQTGTIVAVRHGLLPGAKPGDAPVTQRLVWNGKQFVLQTPNVSGTNWVGWAGYTKKDAYNLFKDDTDWFGPATGTPMYQLDPPESVATMLGLPQATSTFSPSSTATSAAKTAPLSAEDIIGKYGNVPMLDDPAIKEIWTSFKTTSGYGTMMVGKPPDTLFKALVRATLEWNNKYPNNKFNYLQVVKLIDQTGALKAGQPNQNLYEKKIVDWLQTSAGLKQAPTLIKQIEVGVKFEAKHQAQPTASSILAGLKNPYDIGILDKNATDFPMITPSQAAAMHTSMRKKQPLTTEQRQAVYDYTDSGSGGINSMLRNSSSPYGSETTAKKIVAIQDAMAPLPTSMLLHRGTEVMHGALTGSGPITLADVQKQLMGKTFSDGAFFSASVGTQSAFASKKFQIQIEVPAGTPGIYARPISDHKNENELILAAGLHYEVLEVTEKQPGQQYGVKYNIRVRVVSP